MKTTKQLSKAYLALQNEAMEKIKSFFKGQEYVKLEILPEQHLNINSGSGSATVTEIRSNGDILFTQGKQKVISTPKYCEPLPMDALLTILDELERMKKENKLKFYIF